MEKFYWFFDIYQISMYLLTVKLYQYANCVHLLKKINLKFKLLVNFKNFSLNNIF